MQVTELRDGVNNVDIVGTIAEIESPTDIVTKYGYATKRQNGILEDETGKIKITLWGNQAGQFEKGDKLKIENGYVKSFRGEIQLSVGKKGKIEKV